MAQSPVYFRSDGGLAANDEQPLPSEWSGEHLAWKANLPPGQSTPTIVGSRIFLTAHGDRDLITMCLDRIDGKVLETKHGIWFRIHQLLPLSRLQHVDLHSGPVERSFGLASLLLHTAGTQHASIVVPGLDAREAGRLRDELVAMIGGDDGV